MLDVSFSKRVTPCNEPTTLSLTYLHHMGRPFSIVLITLEEERPPQHRHLQGFLSQLC